MYTFLSKKENEKSVRKWEQAFVENAANISLVKSNTVTTTDDVNIFTTPKENNDHISLEESVKYLAEEFKNLKDNNNKLHAEIVEIYSRIKSIEDIIRVESHKGLSEILKRLEILESSS